MRAEADRVSSRARDVYVRFISAMSASSVSPRITLMICFYASVFPSAATNLRLSSRCHCPFGGCV